MLVVHSLAFNFVTDDAYISFVFSRNLAEHGELSFNLGAPVEGYTNFLWTVLLGALMVPGIPPELSSRVLGTACALVTLVLVTRLTGRALALVASPAGERASAAAASPSADAQAGGAAAGGVVVAAGGGGAWAALPALLLASSSGFACWSSGGLETQLFTMLVASALDAVTRRIAPPRAAPGRRPPRPRLDDTPRGAARRRGARRRLARPPRRRLRARSRCGRHGHRSYGHREATGAASASGGLEIRDELAAARCSSASGCRGSRGAGGTTAGRSPTRTT